MFTIIMQVIACLSLFWRAVCMHAVIVRQKYGMSIYLLFIIINRYMYIIIIKFGKTQLYINTVSLLIDGFMVT